MEQYTDELYHYGRKGMKWGQHIFGKEPTGTGRKRTASKSDSEKKKSKSSNSFKSRIEAGRRALGEAKQRRDAEAAKKAEEKAKQKAADEARQKAEAEAKAKADREAKRQEVLSSKSAKALMENANLFSDQELQTAYNRLVLERNISSLVPKEVSKGEAFVNGAIKWGNKVSDVVNAGTRMYESVDKVRKLLNGDSDDNKEFDIELAYKNRNKLSAKALKEAAERAENMGKLKRGLENERKSKNEESGTDDPKPKPGGSTPPSDDDSNNPPGPKPPPSSSKSTDSSKKESSNTTKDSKKSEPKVEKFTATADDILGEGTSHFNWNDKKTSDFVEGQFSEAISNLPSVVPQSARSYVSALLEELE